MIALGTTQASTWGYSTATFPSVITGVSGSGTIVGVFVKPTMAPNGSLYTIKSCATITVDGIVRTNVILKITPGNSNTATTNWSQPTFEYLFPDGSVPVDPEGFSKPTWTQGSGNADVSFNTGVLASNGLIYWPPRGGGQWVILDPEKDKWKTKVIYPTNPAIMPINGATSVVLGIDNKIYVLPDHAGAIYRITTTANASSDTSEFGFYTGLSSTPLRTTLPSTWLDSQGNSYTDTTASLDSKVEAYVRIGTTPSARTLCIIDAIVHPTGRIYLIPNEGRGRIFYLDPENWNNSRQFVSAQGLTTTNALGIQKGLNLFYAFLEKPRDSAHDLNSLKIYLVPFLKTTPDTTIDTKRNTDLLYIDPVDNTMHAVDLKFVTITGPSNNYPTRKRISLSNGATQIFNFYNNYDVSAGGYVLTGKDVPSTDTDGVIKIDRDKKGILQNQSLNGLDSFPPGQSFYGGGVPSKYPNHSKFTSITATSTATGSFVSELVSIKEFGPNITNFNYIKEDDEKMYEPPSLGDISTLGTSLFNFMYNKPK